MVAYSFKKRFVPLIEGGFKLQTIRGHRTRHARLGERVQLYYAQRTKHCRKIIPDPICTAIHDIQINVGQSEIELIAFGHRILKPSYFDTFAKMDGFSDAIDMWAFWYDAVGCNKSFFGNLIGWEAP